MEAEIADSAPTGRLQHLVLDPMRILIPPIQRIVTLRQGKPAAAYQLHIVVTRAKFYFILVLCHNLFFDEISRL